MVTWQASALRCDPRHQTCRSWMPQTPDNLSLTDIRDAMQVVPGVCGIHDLHVWCLGSHLNALACHVTILDIPPSESRRILADINHRLGESFNIHHTTIQFEMRDDAGCAVEDGCLPTDESFAAAHTHSH